MKARRIPIILLATILICAPAAQADDPVYFGDANLKQAVIDALAALDPPIITTDPTPTDMLNLTYLHAGGRGIADLTGLEYATNLTVLNLGKNNNITDISPLAGLTALEQLLLLNNQISDITSLAGLSNLSYLVLERNQINDIGPLSQLANLTYLDVSRNSFTSIAPVSGLTNLGTLHSSRLL